MQVTRNRDEIFFKKFLKQHKNQNPQEYIYKTTAQKITKHKEINFGCK